MSDVVTQRVAAGIETKLRQMPGSIPQRIRAAQVRLRPEGVVRELLASKLFWIVLAGKLVVGATIASTYMRDLFVPFVNYFVESGFRNPWAQFVALGRVNSFPYPPLMLYCLALPRWIFGHFVAAGMDTVTWRHLLLMRLPLLAADVTMAVVLCRWFPGRTKRILKFYWCSPLVIYVTYWHGQLDIIPTAIFVLSLFLLRQGKMRWSFVVFGLALATKTHLLVALPFLLVYAFHKERRRTELMKASLLCVGAYLVALFPFVMNSAFGRMVFATEEQARLIALQISIGKTEMAVLVAPAAMLLLWFRFVAYRETNWDLLMLYLGILFSVFMLLAPPAPGYVLWSLPFLVHFVCRGRQTDSLPFVCYTAAYLAFFWFRPGSDLLDAFRVVSPRIAAIGDPHQLLAAISPGFALLVQKSSFTLMEASLAGMILFMNVVGVRRNDAHRASPKPIMIGVAGDSGVGKDAFSGLMTEALGPERVTVIAGDDYHRWPRGHEMWQVYTHLDVRANNLYEHQEHAFAFSLGRSVLKGAYDHRTGRFTEERMVDPSEVMIFQGLHSLSTDAVRQMYDLKVFLNPEEDLRKLWKVQRDHRERGYEPAHVLQSIENRENDRNDYLLPQMQQADLILRWKSLNPVNPWDVDANPELELEVLAANSFDLTAVVSAFGRCPTLVTEHLPFVDTRWQCLRLKGSVSAEILQDAAVHLGRDVRPRPPRDGLAGCAQLITLTVLGQKLLWRPNLMD